MRKFLLSGLIMPLCVAAQHLDSLHLMVDAQTDGKTAYVYPSFQAASDHFIDGVTVFIRPGVYWIDDPDDATVKVGVHGREPFGMTVRCPHLRLVGLGDEPHDVVLASQRGQTQGAVGNFTMFDFWVSKLQVENLTMGNYCNVDLVYPKNPRLNRPKRAEAITQAHVGYVHGDTLIARKVRFISRLNLNPLNGARHSYYEDCHFECTDDALNGTATYRHCHFDFYGQKPFWSTFGAGALFIDCDFYAKSANKELYFTKQGGPVTVVDCRYHAPTDSVYIGWTAYPQPWLRCYQRGFTLNGKPYVIGNRQPENTLQLASLTTDMQRPPSMTISQHEAAMLTGQDTLCLEAPDAVRWRTTAGYETYVTLRPATGGRCVVCPTNNTDETADFCVVAVAADGRETACRVVVKPAQLPPPDWTRRPRIVANGDMLMLDYELALEGRRDESRITWLRQGIPVSVTHGEPVRSYPLTAADQGATVTAVVAPKHQRSDYGPSVEVSCQPQVQKPQQTTLLTDFHDFPCHWQPKVLPGYWTVDGFKPADTKAFPWSFDTTRPMWTYDKGFNGAVGMGLLQAQRGARLRYTPADRSYGNMHLELCVDPTKTAGQGFGSATGQYMDVCLKFDTRRLTGYGLRIIRTTKHAKAVDFLLVKYDNGVVTPITDPVSATCYRTNCTISVDFNGKCLTAHVETATPAPSDGKLPHVVDLHAEVTPNNFGGVHIQHTGSCGESTTMLHRLKVTWQ